MIVTNQEVKRQIREGAEKEEYENYHGRMPEEWLRVLAPLQTDWHKEFLEIAPALIVVFKQDYGIDAEGRHVTHYYVNESVGIACGLGIGGDGDREKHFAFDSTECEMPSFSHRFPCSLTILG